MDFSCNISDVKLIFIRQSQKNLHKWYRVEQVVVHLGLVDIDSYQTETLEVFSDPVSAEAVANR